MSHVRRGTRVLTWGSAADHGAEVLDPLVERVLATGRAVVGVRPVTDTVKQLDADGFVADTLDREALRAPVGPVVLPVGHPADPGDPAEETPPAWADLLRAVLVTEVDLVEVPGA